MTVAGPRRNLTGFPVHITIVMLSATSLDAGDPERRKHAEDGCHCQETTRLRRRPHASPVHVVANSLLLGTATLQ